MLTNNTKRKDDQVDAANPRARNAHGHVIEMIPPGEHGRRDHAATELPLEHLPARAATRPMPRTARAIGGDDQREWLAVLPGQLAFDSKGRIWISTDGAPTVVGIADGI